MVRVVDIYAALHHPTAFARLKMRHLRIPRPVPVGLSTLALTLAVSLVASNTQAPYVLGVVTSLVTGAIAPVEHVMGALHAAIT